MTHKLAFVLPAVLACGAGCAVQPDAATQSQLPPAPEQPAADERLAAGEVTFLAGPRQGADPAYLPIARVEGYGNPATGELWMRKLPMGPTDGAGGQASGVAGQQQALGYCEFPHSTVEGSMPDGGFEFWTHPEVGDPFDAFDHSLCLSRLPAGADDRPVGEGWDDHATTFISYGVGCAYQRVGNYTGRTFSRVLLDVDVFNGDIVTHAPYGWPFTPGTAGLPGSVPTPDIGRNRPYADLGLWDFGPLRDGETVDMWIYFKNGDSQDFRWTGYLLGEVTETCGDGIDDDCDGVADNGCGQAMAGESCYSESDCGSGSCDGALVVSGLGAGGGELSDDVAGICDVVCGDGLVEGSESCDDFNTAPDDGCDGSCQVEPDCHPPVAIAEEGSYAGSTVGAGNDYAGVCSDGSGEEVIHTFTPHYYGKACIDTIGSSFDTQLSLRSMCRQPATEYACNDDDDGGSQSRLQTTITAGQAVFAMVDGVGGAGGDYTLNVQRGSCCPDGHIDASGDGSECLAITKVATSNHSCALTTGGRLFCWGANTYGQLGDGTTTQRPLPVEVSGGYTDWTDVALYSDRTCAIRSGRLFCWGSNSYGKLGDGTTTQRLTPTEVSGGYTDWTMVAAGNNATCGLRGAGAMYCWGTDGSSRFGNGVTSTSLTPVSAGGGYTDFVHIDLGGNNGTCGVRSTGQGYCWGYSGNGQLGVGATGTYPSPTLLDAPQGQWQQIIVESFSGCGIAGGAAYCWGLSGAHGNDGATTGQLDSPYPVAGGITDFVQIEHVGDGACARRSTGQLYCWGSNDQGQGGVGTNGTSLEVPTEVNGAYTDWSDVAMGGGHVCAVRSGMLHCWGGAGEVLGTGLSQSPRYPSELAGGFTDWQSPTNGRWHSCAIRAGHLYCWGNNDDGQLGDGNSYTYEYAPVEVLGGYSDWTAVHAYQNNTCGIRAGRAYCWGYAFGSYGPQEVVGGYTDWTEITVGYYHACGIRAGRVFCWGDNSSGQGGTGDTAYLSMPTEVDGGGADWEKLDAGESTTCGLRRGALYCWGYNYYGQVGDGSTGNALVPTPVEGDAWSEVSLGYTHTCGVRGGEMWCWGNNSSGQLGIGSTTQSLTPVQVGSAQAWGKLAAGSYHTCATLDGDLRCWGSGGNGQLGNNGTAPQLSPVHGGLGYFDWNQPAAGDGHTCAVRAGGRLYCWGNGSYGQTAFGAYILEPTPAF